jgi:hypothetical protein
MGRCGLIFSTCRLYIVCSIYIIQPAKATAWARARPEPSAMAWPEHLKSQSPSGPSQAGPCTSLHHSVPISCHTYCMYSVVPGGDTSADYTVSTRPAIHIVSPYTVISNNYEISCNCSNTTRTYLKTLALASI